jgi:succinylglutamate desuccinylase
LDSTSARVKDYLKRFDTLVTGLSESYTIESIAHQVHVLRPKTAEREGFGLSGAKDVALTISALIHGVEIGGLAVLVELLELVTRGQLRLEVPLGITLGNLPAAHQAVRFVERDLNRSFGRVQSAMAEERRADELEKLFARSEYLLDIHQVKLQIDRPFWIFPYTKKGYQFARAVAPDVSVITFFLTPRKAISSPERSPQMSL